MARTRKATRPFVLARGRPTAIGGGVAFNGEFLSPNLPEQQGGTNEGEEADDGAVNPAEGGDANNADGTETTVTGQRRMQTT